MRFTNKLLLSIFLSFAAILVGTALADDGCRLLTDRQLKKLKLVVLKKQCTRTKGGHCAPKESYVKYSCAEDFIFKNKDTDFMSVCLPNGNWENVPKCIPLKRGVRVGCGLKKVPNENTLEKLNLRIDKIECSKRKKGLKKNHCLPKESFIKYRCLNNFVFDNQIEPEFSSLCLSSGKWEKVPRCVRISCLKKLVPNKKKLKKRRLVVDKISCPSGRCYPKEAHVKYKCEKGYAFETDEPEFISLCTKSGRWELLPKCVPLTCRKSKLLNARHLKIKHLIHVGTNCLSEKCASKESFNKYKCRRGYVFKSGEHFFTSTCLKNGNWEPVPSCVKG